MYGRQLHTDWPSDGDIDEYSDEEVMFEERERDRQEMNHAYRHRGTLWAHQTADERALRAAEQRLAFSTLDHKRLAALDEGGGVNLHYHSLQFLRNFLFMHRMDQDQP